MRALVDLTPDRAASLGASRIPRLLVLAALLGCSHGSEDTPKDPADSAVGSETTGDTDSGTDTDSGIDTDTDTGPVVPSRLDLGGFTPRNVVVVHVDTLRADSLPAWGSERDTMPLLAARGGWISIERTVSTAPWTAPASASLLTGAPQHLHGVRFHDESGANYPLAAPSFIPFLADQGVATALVTGSQVLTSPIWDLEQGFDYVAEPHAEPGNAAAVVTDAVTWLDTLAPDARFVLVLQPMDMHGPYRPEDGDLWTWADPADLPFNSDDPALAQQAQIEAAVADANSEEERDRLLAALRAAYDEQMLGVDRAVDALMDALEARDLLDDTLIVLTADHGESFYDGFPSHLGHGAVLRQELLSVPLMFRGPATEAVQVPCLASNMDVFPTVVAAMGLSPLDDTQGASLLEGCRDVAFSELYASIEGDEQLQYIGAESMDAQVVFDCIHTDVKAYDLASDPHALMVAEVADVPDGEALAQALRDHTEEVLSTITGVTCAAAR